VVGKGALEERLGVRRGQLRRTRVVCHRLIDPTLRLERGAALQVRRDGGGVEANHFGKVLNCRIVLPGQEVRFPLRQ
jgi:hypothetical protein